MTCLEEPPSAPPNILLESHLRQTDQQIHKRFLAVRFEMYVLFGPLSVWYRSHWCGLGVVDTFRP